MDILNASDAKREFGELLLKAQKEPVGINKNGKPVAVMVSAETFESFQKLQQQYLQMAIDEGLADISAGRVLDGESVFADLRSQVQKATA